MKRNISTTIEFSKENVRLIVIEKIATNLVEIFNSSALIKDAKEFLSQSIKNIEINIGGKIKDVSIIVHPSSSKQFKLFTSRDEYKLPLGLVSYKDIENLSNIASNKFISNEFEVINIHPLRFDLEDLTTKSYSKAPINKSGKKLTIISVITQVSTKIYSFILDILNSLNLKLLKMLLSFQAISQANLSDVALDNGAVLINVSNDGAFVTINKNFATISTILLPHYSYQNLVDKVSKEFECTGDESKNLLSAYASFEEYHNRVIFTQQIGLKESKYTNKMLNKIIELYFRQLLFQVKEYIKDKTKVETLPIIISGKIWKFESVDKFTKIYFSNQNVSIYNPISFIEMNDENIGSIGVCNYYKNMKEIMGKNLDTIVTTNPNTIPLILQKQNKKSLFTRLINKVGEKNDWI